MNKQEVKELVERQIIKLNLTKQQVRLVVLAIYEYSHLIHDELQDNRPIKKAIQDIDEMKQLNEVLKMIQEEVENKVIYAKS